MSRTKSGADAPMAPAKRKKAAKPKAPAKATQKAQGAKKAKSVRYSVEKTDEGLQLVQSANEPRPKGRPSSYTPELADEILDRLAEGEPLIQICRSEHMPAARTVRRWHIDDVEGFSPRYVKARNLQLEHMAEEILDIGDNSANDWMERELKNGLIVEVVNNEVVNRSRLRCDNRKWLLARLKPEQYGDQTKVTHGVTDALAELLGQIDGNCASLI